MLAIDAHRERRFADAEQQYQRILHERPFHPLANHNLGLLLMQQGDVAGALPYLQRALEINPDEGQFWLTLVEALLQANQAEQALEFIQTAMQRGLDNENARGLLQRAQAALSRPYDTPNAPASALQVLGQLYQEGRYAALEQEARSLLEIYPKSAIVWSVLGSALHLQGKDNLTVLRTTASLAPEDAEAHNNLGNALQMAGQLDAAIASYQRALQLQPALGTAHSNLGAALYAARRYGEAEASYRRALAIDPTGLAVYLNLGNVLAAAGQMEAALANYEQALELRADDLEIGIKHAETLQTLCRYQEAEVGYRRALERQPHNDGLLNRLGLVLQAQGQYQAALQVLEQGLLQAPGRPELHLNKGVTLQSLNQFEEATAAYKEALRLQPGFAAAHMNMGVCQRSLGNSEQAIAHFQRAVQADPGFVEAHINLSSALIRQSRNSEAVQVCRAALQRHPTTEALHNNMLYALLHDGSASAASICADHQRFGELVEAPLRATWLPHANTPDPERPLRVGFVSGDFYNHAVTNFVLPLLEHLRRSPRVQLYGYYNNTIEDGYTQRLQACLNNWRPVSALSHDALAQLIRTDGIDILIDLSGHTDKNRLLTFARKPAPVQASWIGYPGTTGLRAMDYYITDHHFTPPEMANQFTEALAYMPAALPFLPAEEAPPVNALPALSNGYITFGSFNRPAKLSREVIALWSPLLRQLPNARLLIGGLTANDTRAKLSAWFAEEGIGSERLDFHPRTNTAAYLALHQQVDICLDTIPYAGGTTTMHALWMGVPVLTLAGATVAGRGSAAILSQLQLDAFICSDIDEFTRKGLDVTRHLPALADLRANLRHQLELSPIGQYEVLALGLEGVLRAMWQRWCTGQPPMGFEIEYFSPGAKN
ncbi:tetratricopeptide repeat protein [Massilia sp. BJB1822]|uniref:tetratricopeptide repeat protein n=1 Tax=Massilia sp. BJB1822 TaxID=2744470 RepID=UPI0015947288|nr:tetratricopeptide repeat protein [Massilia sp. BJB1822]NVD99508.1 tetratricopeptide repeat protein [Massilia sp. BJB1822]